MCVPCVENGGICWWENEASVLSANGVIHQGRWACAEGNRLVLFMEESLLTGGFPAGSASWKAGLLLTPLSQTLNWSSECSRLSKATWGNDFRTCGGMITVLPIINPHTEWAEECSLSQWEIDMGQGHACDMWQEPGSLGGGPQWWEHEPVGKCASTQCQAWEMSCVRGGMLNCKLNLLGKLDHHDKAYQKHVGKTSRGRWQEPR